MPVIVHHEHAAGLHPRIEKFEAVDGRLIQIEINVHKSKPLFAGGLEALWDPAFYQRAKFEIFEILECHLRGNGKRTLLLPGLRSQVDFFFRLRQALEGIEAPMSLVVLISAFQRFADHRRGNAAEHAAFRSAAAQIPHRSRQLNQRESPIYYAGFWQTTGRVGTQIFFVRLQPRPIVRPDQVPFVQHSIRPGGELLGQLIAQFPAVVALRYVLNDRPMLIGRELAGRSQRDGRYARASGELRRNRRRAPDRFRAARGH